MFLFHHDDDEERRRRKAALCSLLSTDSSDGMDLHTMFSALLLLAGIHLGRRGESFADSQSFLNSPLVQSSGAAVGRWFIVDQWGRSSPCHKEQGRQ